MRMEHKEVFRPFEGPFFRAFAIICSATIFDLSDGESSFAQGLALGHIAVVMGFGLLP